MPTALSLVGFHSIGFPSEWGHTIWLKSDWLLENFSFHSIGFPSEWGHGDINSWADEIVKEHKVSIQLVSPASGDCTPLTPIVGGHFNPHLRGIVILQNIYPTKSSFKHPQNLAPRRIEGENENQAPQTISLSIAPARRGKPGML